MLRRLRRGGGRRLRGTGAVPMCRRARSAVGPEDIVAHHDTRGDVDMKNHASEIARDNLHPRSRVEAAELEVMNLA